MVLHRLVRWTMIGCLAVAAAGWWMKDVLPAAEKLSPEVGEAPVQKRVRQPAMDTTVNGVTYRIQPRYSYDMRALVVSVHHSDSWWDYAHKEWGDHVNLMDLCVVWGSNATSGAYRSVSFSNTQWECHWQWYSGDVTFRSDEASNNHMVTDKPEIARALKQVRIGDQIRVQGYLVDYTIFKDGKSSGTRVSSEKRTDEGPGACEVLYVESLEFLGSGASGWRTAMKAALWALLVSVLAWLVLPAKLDD